MEDQRPKAYPLAAVPQMGGTYALFLTLPAETVASVGKMGTFAFPQGFYAYLGSARRGLRARIARHLRDNKAQHWHIDYFPYGARPTEIWYALSQERLECLWASALQGLPGVSMPVRGFGSSDCRCFSHLVHLSSPPSLFDFTAIEARHSAQPVRIYL